MARLERLDGFADGGVLREGEHIGRHDAAGGIGVVAEEGIDLGGLLALPRGEDALGALLVEAVEEVGGIVGGDVVEDLDELVVAELCEDDVLLEGVELGEHLALLVQFGDQPEEGHLLTIGELPEDEGDVGGVTPLQDLDEVPLGASSEELANTVDQDGLSLTHRVLPSPEGGKRKRSRLADSARR